jgi:hypothetical protein
VVVIYYVYGQRAKEVISMATVNKKIADEIIANDGYYEGDPRVVKVVKYQNQFNGEDAYGIIYSHEDPMRYHNSPACINPETVWEA